ncbi:PspC domain-containing protein, partial [Calditrichota bacterium]
MTRIYRSAEDRILAGVCGGLAEITGLNPLAVRLVWALSIFWHGAGLAAYLL